MKLLNITIMTVLQAIRYAELKHSRTLNFILYSKGNEYNKWKTVLMYLLEPYHQQLMQGTLLIAVLMNTATNSDQYCR